MLIAVNLSILDLVILIGNLKFQDNDLLCKRNNVWTKVFVHVWVVVEGIYDNSRHEINVYQ